jgi:ribosomal protein S18 acetylase RimI-like enzyme
MLIRSASKDDFYSIACLHAESIKTGFLSKLGIPFLIELYKAIQEQDGSFVYVCETNEKICGFIAGAIDTKSLYKKVLLKNWFRFVLPIIKFVFNFKVCRMIVETVSYGFKKEKAVSDECSYSAELLSIAVANSGRGKGVGKELVSALEKMFAEYSVMQYKVATFSEDQQSNGFYRSCGFVVDHQFVHHGNVMNQYLKKI